MKSHTIRKQGFTLVELVVVVIILSILSAVSFIAFTSYLSDSRDSRRIVDISTIRSSLETYKKKYGGTYPRPSDLIIVSMTGADGLSKSYSYLGFIKDSMKLALDEIPTDPVTGDYYAYGVMTNGRYYEVSGTLETYDATKSAYLPQQAYADAGRDYAYIGGSYIQDATLGLYPSHLLFLVSSSGYLGLPRANTSIGSYTGSVFTTNAGCTMITHGSKYVPYPIKQKATFKSVYSQSGTTDFYLEMSQTGITISCPNCTS